jgi:glucokinase
MAKISIGVDIGGSHIKSAAVDVSKNEFIQGSIAESKVDNQAPSDEIIDIWSSTIRRSILSVGFDNLAGIGFGMPGPFDYVKGIALFEKVLKYESLYGVNVEENIKNKLGVGSRLPVRFINDATAFAIGEAWLGRGAGYSRIVALTLGSGFGSAFLRDGIPVVTGDEVPEIGAVWHLHFKDGIANDYISTNWFIAEYEKLYGERIPGVKELAQLSQTIPEVQNLFHEYGKNMGIILLPWLQKFKAEVVILGGNVTGAYDLFKDDLKHELAQGPERVQVKISDLKEDAALLGSARLIDDNYFEKVFPTLKYM